LSQPSHFFPLGEHPCHGGEKGGTIIDRTDIGGLGLYIYFYIYIQREREREIPYHTANSFSLGVWTILVLVGRSFFDTKATHLGNETKTILVREKDKCCPRIKTNLAALQLSCGRSSIQCDNFIYIYIRWTTVWRFQPIECGRERETPNKDTYI
jgi:hypothetical protein